MTEAVRSLPELPWMHEHQRSLAAAQAAGRLAHALLIQDSASAGGAQLAHWIARLVLCEEPAREAPCGLCGACRRLAAGTHADLHLVMPIEDSLQIRIEQIRELSDDLVLTSHDGHGSVALIIPADAMNVFAANALLKTLEEPRQGVVVVLVCARPSRLPATLLSRCQRVAIRAPAREEVLAWLQGQRPSPHWPAALDVIGNLPLQALAADPQHLAQLREEMWRALDAACTGSLDVIATAERWSRSDLHVRLACFENWLTTRVRTAFVPIAENGESRAAAHLSSHASDLNIGPLFRTLDSVRELRALAATPINKALAMERLLWQLRRAPEAPGSRGQAGGGHPG